MKNLLNAPNLARELSRLKSTGFMFPVHYSAVSADGSMVFGRYWQPGEAEIISTYCPSGEFVLPLNIMVTDESGQAALINWLPEAEPSVVQEILRRTPEGKSPILEH